MAQGTTAMNTRESFRRSERRQWCTASAGATTMRTAWSAFIAVLPMANLAAAQAVKPEAASPRGVVWPGRDWQIATPEGQGLSARELDAAAAYAQKYGGGSGCVIRHGYLVKEWGDPRKLADIKSATKGTVGTTLLGMAVDRHLLALDDPAVKHYPAMGATSPENNREWFAEITIRQLATMTAGFDDSRPARLVYRPGTDGFYSNDGSNVLAELLTLRFGADLAEVLKREVMDPIGVPPADWRWRENQYRAKTISGLRSREFASGITITHRALARIGYLYLREGEWNGRRILSREFIQTATRPTDLPSFVPYYAFFWGSNGRGTFGDFPRDAYWALGLGDSFVVVCPSLDIVAIGHPCPLVLLDGGQDLEYQVSLKVIGKLIAVAEPDEDEVEAGNDEAVVMVTAEGHDQVGRGTGNVGRGPPLAAVVGLDRCSLPGEVVVRGRDDPLASPFALVHRQVAEPGVLARVGVDAAIALAERADRPCRLRIRRAASSATVSRRSGRTTAASRTGKDLRRSPDGIRAPGERRPRCYSGKLRPGHSGA